MKNLPSIKAIIVAIITICCIQFSANKITELTVLQPTAAFTTLGNTLLESVTLKRNQKQQIYAFNESMKQEIEVVTLATSTPLIVYDGMTMEQLVAKLDRSLSSDLSGYGASYAKYSLEYGVDPYMAVAISLLETGCTWDCSYLVKSCNNVGGMKGNGCGSYGSFDSLDAGIEAMIRNLSTNYVQQGLTTPETIGPKYAESKAWPMKVTRYMDQIRAN